MKKNYKKAKNTSEVYIIEKIIQEKQKINTSLNGEVIQMNLIVGCE